MGGLQLDLFAYFSASRSKITSIFLSAISAFSNDRREWAREKALSLTEHTERKFFLLHRYAQITAMIHTDRIM